jgi:hypothetical protein
MKLLVNNKIIRVPLLKVVQYFPKKSPKTVYANGAKLWGFRGDAPNAKKPPCPESFSNCKCNRCRLSLQALPTSQI